MDEIEPRINGGLIHERRANICCEEPRACARYSAVHDGKQTACARAAGGTGQFQTFSRGRINEHLVRRGTTDRRLEKGQSALPGMI